MRSASIRGIAQDAVRVARLAWREGRGAGRHFAYLVACVALGVAALVAVASLGAGVERTVARSARSLMGADVEVRSTRPLSSGAEAALGALAREGIARTSVVELVGDGARRRADPARRAQGGRRGIPVLRRAGHRPRHPAADADRRRPRARPRGAAQRLGLAVGDRVRVGEAELAISGRILQEPDRGDRRLLARVRGC